MDSRTVAGAWASDRTLTILSLILLVALALRIWATWWGLPYLFHNDEGNEIIRAMQLGAGDYNFARISKGGFFYLLFVEYGILFVVLMALGVVSSPTEFAEYFVREPSLFYLIARITAAIIGAATVYLVYRIARHAYSAAAGLFAAGLLAVNVLHTNLSHYATVDVPMTALA